MRYLFSKKYLLKEMNGHFAEQNKQIPLVIAKFLINMNLNLIVFRAH